jgi:hypothetical protein
MIKTRKKQRYAFSEILENKEYFAEKFAENNEELKSLLMSCFNNKIETIKCSPGKPGKEGILKPYITFRLNQTSKNIFRNVLKDLQKDDLIITFDYSSMSHRSVTIKTLDEKNKLFSRINYLLVLDASDDDKEITKVFDFVMKLKAKDTSIKMIYSSSGVKYYVKTSDNDTLLDLERNLFKHLETEDIKLKIK